MDSINTAITIIAILITMYASDELRKKSEECNKCLVKFVFILFDYIFFKKDLKNNNENYKKNDNNIEQRLKRKKGIRKIISYLIVLALPYPLWFALMVLANEFDFKDIPVLYRLVIALILYALSIKSIVYIINMNNENKIHLKNKINKPLKLILAYIILFSAYIYLIVYDFIPEPNFIFYNDFLFPLTVIVGIIFATQIYFNLLFFLEKKFYKWNFI